MGEEEMVGGCGLGIAILALAQEHWNEIEEKDE